MISELLRKTVFPLVLIGLLLLAFHPVCVKDGSCDYFLLWILVGLPFGIGKMLIWIVPKNFGLAGSLGVFALNIILGGLIGGVVVIIKVFFAISNLFCVISRRLIKGF